MSERNAVIRRLLGDAGISRGMRVLDVGSGWGEVSVVLAGMVGEEGEVIGLERDPQALGRSRERVEEMGLSQVRFVEVDLSGALPELPEVDAIVGRRVLMYLPDPAATLKALLASLRPGGVVAFEETDSTLVPGRVSSFPLHDQVVSWMWQTVAKEGANTQMGFALPGLYKEVGLTMESLRAEAVIEGQGMDMADIVPFTKHRVIAHGVATEEEIDAENLPQKMRAERAAHEVYISGMSFGIWGRLAG